jgi:hypothetical protein
MPLFKKKEQKQEPMPEKTEVQEIKLSDKGKKEETQEVTLEQVISANTESWYKAQVLEQLNAQNQTLNLIGQILDELLKESKKV